jgi:hypothetical protein
MMLANMRELGVQRLIASCLNDACRHTALIEVWSYPAETEIPYFRSRVVCARCGSRGNHIDVRPNWKEQPPGGEGVAMSRTIFGDAIFAIVFAIVMVTAARFLWAML